MKNSANNSFENKFKKILAIHLNERHHNAETIEITEVLSFKQVKGWIGADDTFGGCETSEVEVKAIKANGNEDTITLTQPLHELVSDLFETARRHGIS